MSLPQTDRQLSVLDIASIEGPIRARGEGFGEMNFSNGVDLLRWQTEHPNTKIWTIKSNNTRYVGELPELEVTAKGVPTQDILTEGIDQNVQLEEKPTTQGNTYADRFFNMSDWDSLLGQDRVNINKRAWENNPEYMLGWTDAGNIAAGFTVAPFATAAGEYAIPWLSENIFPYLSAKGWLAATQAAGNTPAWLTPTSAAAIDATLAGTATGASINDMIENGPTVENVLGTTLGGIGLAYEAAPTIMDGYTAARNIMNLKNQNNRLAISDLFSYIKNGQYRNTFSINPETNLVSWTIELPEGNVPFLQEAIKRGYPRNGRAGNFYISTDRGTITFNPELLSTSYTSRMPELYGGWGEAYLGTVNGRTDRMVLTAPRTDQGGTNLNLPATLPKDLIKDFWITGRAITKPGTYISGDEGIYPLGLRAIQTYRESGFWPAIKTALLTENYPYRIRIGLSPDSYSSIIRQAQRGGSELRWGEGFYNWNPSAVENKAIYDAFNNYKKGVITLQDYEKIFNDWAIPLGGRPLQFTTNSYGRVLPIHPHPYIYIKRKGGKLNGKD